MDRGRGWKYSKKKKKRIDSRKYESIWIWRHGGHFVNLKFGKLILKRNSVRGALFFHVSQVNYPSFEPRLKNFANLSFEFPSSNQLIRTKLYNKVSGKLSKARGSFQRRGKGGEGGTKQLTTARGSVSPSLRDRFW